LQVSIALPKQAELVLKNILFG